MYHLVQSLLVNYLCEFVPVAVRWLAVPELRNRVIEEIKGSEL